MICLMVLTTVLSLSATTPNKTKMQHHKSRKSRPLKLKTKNRGRSIRSQRGYLIGPGTCCALFGGLAILYLAAQATLNSSLD